MILDRHTKAVRPGKRRVHVEVLAETRDWLVNQSGARGVPLGRVIDEVVRSWGEQIENARTDRNHYLEHVYDLSVKNEELQARCDELRELVREMIGCDLTDPLDELNAKAEGIAYGLVGSKMEQTKTTARESGGES